MGIGKRGSKLVLSWAGFALCACLFGGESMPQQSAAGSQAKTDAPPLAVPKRFHRAANGQLYVPAGVPVNLDITLSGQGEGAGASQKSSVVLKEGPSSLDFGGARVPVIADGTPPRTQLDLGMTLHVEKDGVRILAQNPKFHLTATDGLSGVAETLVSLDGGPFVPLPPGGPAFATPGDHRLRYYSVDQVGNMEPVQEYAFHVDAAPPESKMDITGPHTAKVVGAGVTISLSARDAEAGVDTIEYRIDERLEQEYDKPIVVDTLPEGPHRLRFYARDKVGNAEAEQTYSFTIDRQPPEISLAIHGPLYTERGVRYVSPQAQIELSGRDNLEGQVAIHYRIDDAKTETTYSGPFHVPAVSAAHRFRLESEDQVGNRAEVVVSDIYVDTTPPTTELEVSRPFFLREGVYVIYPTSKIALNASDFESGVESVSYSVDGDPPQTYAGPFSIAGEGEHRVTVSSVDRVGNRETAHDVRIHVQPQAGNTAPQPPVLDAKRFYQHPKLGLMAPPGLPFEVRISESPDEGAENYLINSGPAPSAAEASQEGGPLAFVTPGPNKLKVAISPRKAAAFGIAIDGAPPKTELSALGAHRAVKDGVTYFGPGLKIALTAQDDSSSVASGVWKTLESLNGSSFATYARPLDVFTHEGAYTLRYYSLDNVGNAETPHTMEFTVDTTPPKTRLVISGPHHASTVSPATRIALNASDNLAGVAQVEYQIDDGRTMNYTEPFAFAALREGPHQLRYFAVDAVENREEQHTWPFTLVSSVSTSSLEIRGISVVRGSTVYIAPGSLIVLHADEGSPVMYSLDGAPSERYAKPIPAPELGNHRLSFHSEDDLNNVGEIHNITLVVDRTAPISRLHFEGPSLMRESGTIISGATRIAIDTNAGPVGSAALEYSLGGGHWQPYAGPFSIKSSGTFEVAYRGRSPLGVVESVERQRVVVDALGPVISLGYSEPVATRAEVVQVNPGTLVIASAEDVPAGLEKITYKIDDQPEVIYRAPLSGFTPGRVHTVTIAAVDLLGNRSEKTVHLEIQERGQ